MLYNIADITCSTCYITCYITYNICCVTYNICYITSLLAHRDGPEGRGRPVGDGHDSGQIVWSNGGQMMVKWCGQMLWSSGGQIRRIGGGVGASSAVTATGSARSNGGQIVPVTATGSARSNSGQRVPVTGTGSANATWLSAAISLYACNIALCLKHRSLALPIARASAVVVQTTSLRLGFTMICAV